MSDSIKKWHEIQDDNKWTTDTTGYSYNNIPKDPIVESVLNKYKTRSRDGIIKYNTTLMITRTGFISFLRIFKKNLWTLPYI